MRQDEGYGKIRPGTIRVRKETVRQDKIRYDAVNCWQNMQWCERASGQARESARGVGQRERDAARAAVCSLCPTTHHPQDRGGAIFMWTNCEATISDTDFSKNQAVSERMYQVGYHRVAGEGSVGEW